MIQKDLLRKALNHAGNVLLRMQSMSLLCLHIGLKFEENDAIKEAKISKLNEAMTNKFVVCVYGRPYISQSAKDRYLLVYIFSLL